MIVLTPTVFECLICTLFLFLYLHMFSTTEHVSHGKALQKYAHHYYYYLSKNLNSFVLILIFKNRADGMLTSKSENSFF